MFHRRGSIRVFLVLTFLIAIGAYVFWPEKPELPKEITVAFIGDTYAFVLVFLHNRVLDPPRPSFVEALAMHKIDVLFHGGDITYLKEPAKAWNSFLAQQFLRFVPVIATAGNADINEWKTYQEITEKHNNKTLDAQTGELRCGGIPGIQSYCAVRGMLVVQLVTEPQIQRAASLLGYSVSNNPQFIEKAFNEIKEETTLKICHFHNPYVDYRVEIPRTDTVDVAEYEACREQGAIVVTAHDHIYARTELMSDYIDHTTVPQGKDNFVLKPGTSFSIISGLGGKSTVKLSEELVNNPWWAKIWPGAKEPTRNSEVGVFICKVPVTPKAGSIRCFFQSGKGKIVDEFSFTTDYN